MREMLNLPDTHRIGIVPGSDTGAFEMAMWTMLGARPVTTLAWESFGEGWVTDAVKQLKIDPTVIRADYGAAARPGAGRLVERRAVHLERHDQRRARPRCRLDPGESRRPVVRRCDQRGVRLSDRLGQDRCRDVQLAEGAGRGGRAWRADPGPARGRAARELYARLAAAQGVPPDVEGQARRGRVQGRDDQHPLDARGRGCDLRARMGQVARAG